MSVGKLMLNIAATVAKSCLVFLGPSGENQYNVEANGNQCHAK